jgi:ATP-dependent RNA helicase RhlE
VYPVPQHLKPALLVELVKRGVMPQALVFTRTKHRANRLAEHLSQSGIAAERIHGNRSQGQRTQALSGFKNGRYTVLVATDLASRGIDIDALSHVNQFRRAGGVRRLHSPRGPHRTRGIDRRGVYVRGAG